MPRVDGETLRAWRRSRGWDPPKMAQELRRAAGDEPMPAHDSLIRMIRRWERGDHLISERYELLYRAMLSTPGTPEDAARSEDEVVRRHDFLTLAGAATASVLAGSFAGEWPGRQLSARPAPVGEATVSALTAITGAQRKLEATTPARDLAKSVMAHADTAHRTLIRAEGSPLAAGIAAALSEACGLAAWLNADMADTGTARACYRMAVQAARHAGSDLLAGYMLGSLAVFEADAGVPSLGLPLIEQARQQIGAVRHSTPAAWLYAVQALTLAGSGEGGEAAWRALGHAEQVLARDADTGAPPWPWIFRFD